jgi:hypothetical protein
VAGIELAVAGTRDRGAHLGVDGGVGITKEDLKTLLHKHRI